MNSGEGGFLTTNDPELAARAVISSGSYMIYGTHGAIPGEDVFGKVRLDSPNCSARMDNLRAAILRHQLPHVDAQVVRWNARYGVLRDHLSQNPAIHVPVRHRDEHYVGSSFQFQLRHMARADIPAFVQRCAARGVEIKWFGGDQPTGFTSRYDSWKYLGDPPDLPRTREVLGKTCDLRVPLTFDEDDCRVIAGIVGEEAVESGK
jgi:dTDP-4-amino-4,6-dideoxygalactose transaminase